MFCLLLLCAVSDWLNCCVLAPYWLIYCVQEHAGEEEDEEPEDFGDGYFAPYQKVSVTDIL